MAKNTTRVTVTIPSDMDKALAALAFRLGITKSSLVATLLEESVPGLWDVIKEIPPHSGLSNAENKRLRGRSAPVIRERLSKLQDSLGDLLDGVPIIDSEKAQNDG